MKNSENIVSVFIIHSISPFTGIGLSYNAAHNATECVKMIDCLDLTARFVTFDLSQPFSISLNQINSTGLPDYAKSIAASEPLIAEEIVPDLIVALERLQLRLREPVKKKFYHFKTLKTHILPLTNVVFDKAGTRYVVRAFNSDSI